MSPDPDSRTPRLGPWTGVLAGVLGVAAFATAAGAPATSADGKTVLGFYTEHGGNQKVSDTLWTLAFVALVFFTGHLVARLRSRALPEHLRVATLAGVAILAGAGTLFFGLDYVLAAMPRGVDPAVAQTVNVLAQQLFLPLVAGMLTFGLAAGAGILVTRGLPVWLGWVAVVVSLLALSPVAIFAVAGIFLWSLAAGIAMVRSGREVLAPTAAVSH
jgi:hypothetical protein